LKKLPEERDEISLNIWHNLINALGRVIKHPAKGYEDFEGNFVSL